MLARTTISSNLENCCSIMSKTYAIQQSVHVHAHSKQIWYVPTQPATSIPGELNAMQSQSEVGSKIFETE